MTTVHGIRKILIIVVIIFTSATGYTQNIDIIRNIAKQFQSGQITREQAIQRAREQGVTMQDVQQAREQAPDSIQQQISELEGSTTPDIPTGKETTQAQQAQRAEQQDTAPTQTEKRKQLDYFGYDIFKGRADKYQPSDIGQIDPQYLVGPGDEIIISMWGATELRAQLNVSREGTIFIDQYGQMSVNGLTLQELEDKLTKNLSRIYSGLKPQQGGAKTYLDVSLGKLRSIQVYVVGKVQNPGSRFVSNYSTAFTALFEAGGPTTKGSMRQVKVLRNGKLISTLDLYNFITEGKRPNDTRLQNQDVIYVPPRINTIRLRGDVKQAALYELQKDETLKQLIKYSGGLPTSSDVQKVQIERIKPFHERTKEGEVYDVTTPTLGKQEQDTFNINPIPLADRDIVTIQPITGQEHKKAIPGGAKFVNISGHIYKPGRYVLGEDMELTDLLSKAGGLKDSVFWGETYQLRADLIRYKENSLDRKIISVPLKELLKKGADQHNHTLHHRDSVIIYNAGVVYERKQVSIHGEIKNPGQYILEDNMNIHDLLLQAGGFTKRAYKYNIEVFRLLNGKESDELSSVYNVDISPDILQNLESEEDFPLRDYDMLVVRKDPDFEPHRVVNITGEVQYPGRYPLITKNETLGDLLQRTGGLTEEAFLPGLNFLRADSQRVVGVFSEKMRKQTQEIMLHSGDEIHIPKHPGTVRVSGSVRNPGLVQYHEGWDMQRYIEAAGDYNFDAAEGKTIVYYPEGNARRKHWLWNPDIKEGSEIFVPEKPEREPVDLTQLLTNWASIATSVATVIYIIQR